MDDTHISMFKVRETGRETIRNTFALILGVTNIQSIDHAGVGILENFNSIKETKWIVRQNSVEFIIFFNIVFFKSELRIVASTASMLEEQGRRQVRNAYQVIYT